MFPGMMFFLNIFAFQQKSIWLFAVVRKDVVSSQNYLNTWLLPFLNKFLWKFLYHRREVNRDIQRLENDVMKPLQERGFCIA
jgi:hypothetical protein